jgi:hypothetical protein
MHLIFHHHKGNGLFLRRGGTTTTAISTTELRSKLARSTTLLALTTLTPSVTALTIATVAATATAERSSLTLALAEHATGRSVRSLLLDVGGRNDLSGKVEPFAEVVEALGGQGVVVVLPRELSLDIAAGGERLASLDDEQVLSVDIGVLGKVEVLRSDEDTLSEEVLVDLLTVGLGNQHRGGWCCVEGSMLERGRFRRDKGRSRNG